MSAATSFESPLDRVLSRLQNVKRTASGYTARCPVSHNHSHGDAHRSLTVSEGRERRAIVKCHKGCTFQEIAHALNLRETDFFQPSETPPKTNGHDPAQPVPVPTAALNGKADPGPVRTVEIYDYQRADGSLAYQIVRKSDKSFPVRRPDGKGGWIWNKEGIEPVLYKLPALLQADPSIPVWVPEGEKDVNRLISLGLVATTNPFGAKNWRPEFAEQLAGRYVVVLPDNDPDGHARSDAIVASTLSKAAGVKVVDLPDLPPKGDVSDWLDANRTLDDLLAVAKAAPSMSQNDDPRLRNVVRVWELPEPGPRRWFMPGWMPDGYSTVLFGDGGMGKSYLALYFAMLACLGERFGSIRVDRRRVLYVDVELNQEEFRRRAYAVARGMGRTTIPENLHYYRLDGSIMKPDVQLEVAQIVGLLNVGLTVLDSLSIAMSGGNAGDSENVIPIMRGIEQWGTVIALDHVTKAGANSNRSESSAFGSVFKKNIARSTIRLLKASGGGLSIQHQKTNFGPLNSPIYIDHQFHHEGEREIVSFTPTDIHDEAMAGISEHLPPIERVFYILSEQEDRRATVQYLAKALDVSESSVKNYLTALKKQERVDTDHRGVWEIVRAGDEEDDEI